MSAKLRALGILKSYLGDQSDIVVEAGRTVRETMGALDIPPEIVALVLVNDTPQSKEYHVQEGDVVTLVAVVGGGQRPFAQGR